MSMDCPKCGFKGACTESRRKRDASVTRNYKCRKKSCDWRWSTTEIIVTQGTRKSRLPENNTRCTGASTLREKMVRDQIAAKLKDLAEEYS